MTFKVFFNWAVRRQYLDRNPIGVLKRPNRTRSRERVLADAELRTLLGYTLTHRSRFNDIVSLLISTGQRKGEIANMEWSEINGDTLILPAERTKNKHEHAIPLGTHALELLNSIQGGPRCVFAEPGEDTPLNGWSRAQSRIVTETGIDHFTLHDLRRTFSTIHARLGTRIHVTERLLNHVSGSISGVAAIYNRHDYLQEMRVAQTAYDDFLAKLIPGWYTRQA